MLHVVYVHVHDSFVLGHSSHFEDEWIVHFCHNLNLIEQMLILPRLQQLVLALQFHSFELVLRVRPVQVVSGAASRNIACIDLTYLFIMLLILKNIGALHFVRLLNLLAFPDYAIGTVSKLLVVFKVRRIEYFYAFLLNCFLSAAITCIFAITRSLSLLLHLSPLRSD